MVKKNFKKLVFLVTFKRIVAFQFSAFKIESGLKGFEVIDRLVYRSSNGPIQLIFTADA